MTTRARRDQGSATAYACILAALISATGMLVVTLGRVAVHHARASSAADLAALAAAARGAGDAESCARAATVAAANHARLVACTWSGSVVTVTVQVLVRRLPGLPDAWVSAQSRAGPQE